jgi:ribonucleoside-diphosphate reductase alpha chain
VGKVTALAGSGPRGEAAAATALKPEPEEVKLAFSRPQMIARRAEAKAKGYEGEACGECGNFTLVRNGTCLKCETCGSTTGCS